jgi:hypothetical protein
VHLEVFFLPVNVSQVTLEVAAKPDVVLDESFPILTKIGIYKQI